MPHQSTSTLLDVANKTLLALSERPLPNLSSLIGQKARQAVESSCYVLSQETDWSWLQDTRQAQSWSIDGLATLGDDVQKVEKVNIDVGGGRILPIPFLLSEDFYSLPLVSYTGNTNRPNWWTVEDWTRVRVRPYPTDLAGQALISFTVQRWLQVPTNENQTFAMPEMFVPLLLKRSIAEFALKHTEDRGMAQSYMLEYREHLDQLRSRHRSTPARSQNMYKRRRF